MNKVRLNRIGPVMVELVYSSHSSDSPFKLSGLFTSPFKNLATIDHLYTPLILHLSHSLIVADNHNADFNEMTLFLKWHVVQSKLCNS